MSFKTWSESHLFPSKANINNMPISTSTLLNPTTSTIRTSREQDDSSELALLSNREDVYSGAALEKHDLSTAPLISREAMILAGSTQAHSQYGVMGSLLEICDKSSMQAPGDPRLYLNTNAPFSALICGVQGSGKSHTVSTMLENMFIVGNPIIGSVQKPLAGLVLHFGEGSSPCEAAWVGVPDDDLGLGTLNVPTIRVFVSKSSLKRMRGVYARLGDRVHVEPLLFSEEELDAQAFLSMMAVGSSDGAPLYMQAVLAILRDLGENYTYKAFSDELEKRKSTFNPAQRSGLEQRLSLLNSFTKLKSPHSTKALPTSQSRFGAGQLTIIDLSDPFIDAASACGLFEIIIRLFVRADLETGKVLLVDEAHKYLASGRGSSGLTQALLQLARQQRHLGMRVIISTQEPTVVPAVIIDLCSIVFLHRFSSPSWWEHIIKHVSANFSDSSAFDKLVTLETGQAIVLAPAALQATVSDKTGKKMLCQVGRRYMIVKTRKRVTCDGGASILVLS